MSRRRVVAIVSASMILFFGVIAGLIVVSLTQTSAGRGWVRRNLMALVNARLSGRGTVYLGRLSGGWLTQLVIDSVAIRDAEDSLFVSTGRVRLHYDPRDLADGRLLVSSLEVDHPVVNLRRHADRDWNFRRIFPHGDSTRTPRQRSFGDFVMIDSLVVHHGTVILTMPWHPDPWLRGKARDSAIVAELVSPDHHVRPTSEGLKKTIRWTGLELRSPSARLADPDSAGQHIVIGSATVREDDPPLDVHDLRGDVRLLGDTAWLFIHHFDLPASTGRASGTIEWGGDEPTRYAVRIIGDSASLRDMDWVYPTLPTSGSGTLEVDIHNDPSDLHVLDYALRKMDVRSTRSRLSGTMTFVTGRPMLGVTDVNLAARPVNFDLLRTLAGGPFPVDWQGDITGTVRGPGGPLDRFKVDDAHFTFADAHVPGAVSRGSAHGELDIQAPARAVFHAFDVQFQTLDLRSIEFLFPAFPRLAGTVFGSATLDSSWMDVRVSHADITHQDGAGTPTHFTGSGRVTDAEPFMVFDLDLQADPLSFTTLAGSYSRLPLRGPYTGPLRVRGTTQNLELAGSLTGAGGTMALDGHFDLDAPGYLARATGSVRNLDLRTLLDRPALPSTLLTGSFRGDLSGDSLANLAGELAVGLERSRVDSTTFLPSAARVTFADGVMRVDSLDARAPSARLLASGGLGLIPNRSDSLRYTVTLDSLALLRPYLPWRSARRDSLGGQLEVHGTLAGSLHALSAAGTVTGSDVTVGTMAVANAAGRYSAAGLPAGAHGTITASLDSITAGELHFADATAALAMSDAEHGRLSLRLAGDSAPSGRMLHAASTMRFARVGPGWRVAMDTLGLHIGDHSWALAAPVHVELDSTTVVVDSLLLGNGAGGRIAMRGQFPTDRAVSASLTADSVPLSDVGALTQSGTELHGFGNMAGVMAGTRAHPTLRMTGRFADARIGALHVPMFTVRGSYANERLDAALQVLRDSQPVLSATGVLPMDLALHPVEQRMLPDSLTGRIYADSVDLSMLEAISSELTGVRGRASTDLTIGGTWRHPTLTGRLMVHDGEATIPRAGVQLRMADADLVFAHDSIAVRQLSAVSGQDDGDRLDVSGTVHVPDYASIDSTSFNLAFAAHNFAAFDQRTLSRLELSGRVRLTGAFDQARLTGAMTVDRGTVYLPDLSSRRNVVALDENDPDFYDVVDTTFGQNRGIVPQVSPRVKEFMTHLQVPDLRIQIGDDVWLRSGEANIKLGGSVDLAQLGGQRLSGTLKVVRGTYRLDLGLVQRSFQVDSGSIVFYGDPEIPATLDVYASYIVRQPNRQNIRIIAHVGGTVANPTLQLSNSGQFALSLTEILSYLTFGAPTFALGGPTSAALRPVASALLPTIGGVIEQQLSDIIGVLDYVQVQPGSVGDETTSQESPLGVLWGSRIGVGKQIGERTFVTANYGLCKLGGTGSNQSLADELGVTVERRLNDGFSVEASSEPASTALLCGRPDDRNTPRQFGLDLFREWSF
ncbi:MAG TPA: translocation/assembly module TamB domain-containing protein [Gemmatimonadaceae bacterium]|nr:translocation/assembly module TamB domain-containing protein [Gemmatimonadaceae bacterium]